MDEPYYLYALTWADVPPQPPQAGVDPRFPVEIWPAGRVAGIVSRVGLDQFRIDKLQADTTDVAWLGEVAMRHNGIVAALARRGTVLPLKLGTLFQSRCVRCEKPFPDKAFFETAQSLPKCSTCGNPVRPHIVWFGEMPMDMESIYQKLESATVLLVVGSSGSVYPAAAFVNIAKKQGATTIYVGPEAPHNLDLFNEFAEGTATQVLPVLFKK